MIELDAIRTDDEGVSLEKGKTKIKEYAWLLAMKCWEV
jgi:hypothetical protein